MYSYLSVNRMKTEVFDGNKQCRRAYSLEENVEVIKKNCDSGCFAAVSRDLVGINEPTVHFINLLCFQNQSFTRDKRG